MGAILKHLLAFTDKCFLSHFTESVIKAAVDKRIVV